MTHGRPTFDELANRVAQSAAAHGGSIPRNVALVWDGDFAALLEWGLISADDHFRLLKLLPDVPASPASGVFLGYDRPEGRAEPHSSKGGHGPTRRRAMM
jgi:hypothetical protein